MSNPEKAAAQIPEKEQQKEGAETFQTKVNSALEGLTKNEETGKYEFPEDLSEDVRIAADAERRRRDTQSAYSKKAQENKSLEAENEKLKSLLAEKTTVSLSNEEKEELDELKYSDPEAWRRKMNDLEAKAGEDLQNTLGEISTEAGKSAELVQRQQLLDAYNEAHPGAELTDEVIKNDIPPRITNKLANGEITFKQFLDEVTVYRSGFKVGQEEVDNPTNLGEVGGGSEAQDDAVNGDIIQSYAEEIF